ncbi:DNA polymerase III subunit chi [Flavimaricola marinus]|uniref:DNA polymerase III subunit chi n=1 Tax=Flavimaricola marinus TaxID=1819565 RepID=A0A238LJN8_9RHOB|nr:DNA polymerase III subunit chi [Flavimaricola marinus]SMY09614.1 DNA polymerase III subunit chi [Flavimaricola marinus]
MGQTYFYHLTESPLSQTLPMLIGKARGAGWRVIVRGPSADLLDDLDKSLWLGAQDSFLPHGRAGGAHDALQPVLLCAPGEAADEEAECLMIVGGADVAPDEVAKRERVCILFDGFDGAALEHARGQWKTLTKAGAVAQYWAQEDGRWTKKAESG